MAFVRVKGPDGSEFSIDEAAVKGMQAEVLNKPALDINGRVLPPTPHTDKAGQPKASAPKNDNKES